MFVAAVGARFVNVAAPLTAVIFVAPSNVPAPLLAIAVTSSVSLLRTLLKLSSIRTTGCCASALPAATELEGCVEITRLLAGAALTVVVGLVLGGLDPSVTSVAVPV